MNSFSSRRVLKVEGEGYEICSLRALEERKIGRVSCLPFSIKILLENLLRHEDGLRVRKEDIESVAAWDPQRVWDLEISFQPARVLLQDFTGVPVAVDLAAMRDQMAEWGGDPTRVNPVCPVDLVIDHSVQVDAYGSSQALRINSAKEFERNRERYLFLRWGGKAFKNFRVVPPATGIVHQVNLEYLASVVFCGGSSSGARSAYPDTLVGTDSHTTMINGLGVLGWGVGGIEAEAALLGQPLSFLVPQVVGVRLSGELPEGSTATDLVLTITQILRKKGVVGKFVEFFGPGLSSLTLPDRATLSNMCPEYGATVGFFPVDAETLSYLRLTGREEKHVKLAEAYLKHQGLFRTSQTPDPDYSDTVEVDLRTVGPSLAGPRRPQDLVPLAEVRSSFQQALSSFAGVGGGSLAKKYPVETEKGQFEIGHGTVVIAAITSCTNTSNPEVMLEAGLLAKKAVERGLRVPPWVKTSLAPGSKVVMDYLADSGLLVFLEKLGFYLVGYGCTTCIGNSGPLAEPIEKAIREKNLAVVAVLSGNRNFEGRIHPAVSASYLASPPLAVAYALAGQVDLDLTREPLGKDSSGRPVYLKEIWPGRREVREAIRMHVRAQMFHRQYATVFEGNETWSALPTPEGGRYRWEAGSTYVRRPSFLEKVPRTPPPSDKLQGARVLALLGDSVTTDHISPAGSISPESPAGRYLITCGVAPQEFNSYGSRRGNHEVMVRGTFSNPRLRNHLIPGTEGGWTRHLPDGERMTLYDAAVRYRKEKVPLVILAGKEYGSGSSRDWAAKGPALLGVRIVLAESFERIHRSNLIGMGILPLEFRSGEGVKSLGLTGEEVFDLEELPNKFAPGMVLRVFYRTPKDKKTFEAISRIDTPQEWEYYGSGGILPSVLRKLRG
ncbi:MAG: aconitate hydratase AcnA [Elusimicrobia bacterium]|nr:aconitate hydratase AcnA [Elusimicrobiota bacterium]